MCKNKHFLFYNNSIFPHGIKASTILLLILNMMTSLSLNAKNFVTLKLTQSNYLLWREQVLGLAESRDLVDHLTRETPIPTKYTILNPNTTET